MSAIRATPLRERVPRLAEAAVLRARLTVVPSRRRVRAPRVPFVTLVSLVLVGGIVGLLCFNTQMQQASFAATALEEQAANLTARQQTLHDELQELRDPQRVAQLAQQAGMVIPESACTLQLGGAAKPTGQCAAATRANTPTLLEQPPKMPAVLNPAPNVVLVPAPRDQRPGNRDRRAGQKPAARR